MKLLQHKGPAPSNAGEANDPLDHHELGLRQSNVWVKAITWTLVIGSVAGLGWLAFAKTEEVVVAPGKLEPVGQVQQIQIPVGGVVSQILVREGQSVKRNQLLMRLDTASSLDKQRTLTSTIANKQRELALKDLELRRYLEQNSAEEQQLRKNLELQEDILRRLADLNKEGASPELQVLQQQNKVQETRGQLEQVRLERLRQEAAQEQLVQALQSDLASQLNQRNEAEVTLRYQEIRSPVNGVVFDLKPKGPGFVAQGSEPVLKIVPYDKLEAQVEIFSRHIGFVRTGQAADLSIDSFPASDFGVLQGTVTRIGSDALPPDPQRQLTEYRFPARISLASQQLKLKSGKPLSLQAGMSLEAHIKLRKVSYLQLLLGGFQDKGDALRQL